MTVSARQVVEELAQAIARRVGEPRYNFWFDRKTRFTCAGDVLVVGVPNRFLQEWLERTFADTIREEAAALLGRPVAVRFDIEADLFQAFRREQAAVGEQTARTGEATVPPRPEPAAPRPADPVADGDDAAGDEPVQAAPPPETAGPRRRSRRWKRLDDFVVGPCNRLAHASAVSVVEDPGQCANPLVLHGPVGTGKTHLLEGIYLGLRRTHPDWRVCFVTAEDFTNRFVQAMRLGKLGGFRKQYRECETLLIDDLNFLASKRATQEEFLHTFDALQADGRQVVLTCDCHPKLAEEFTPELTDRLLGGAVWGVQPPDEDTRLQILRAKATPEPTPLPEDVLRLIAAELRGNVRELEGALNTLRHYSRVTGRAVDAGLAREALGDLFRHSVRLFQLADVDRAVCRALRLAEGSLQARQRSWAVSHPRMLAMYLARKHTSAAYTEIGRHFGGRNHSTAVAAEKKVRRWLRDDGELALGERRLRVREVLDLAERELHRG